MSKYSIKELTSTEYDQWNNFVNDCETGTVFHLTHVLEPLGKYFHCTFKLLALFNKDNQIVAGIPYLFRSKFILLKISYFPPMIPFYGILIKEKKVSYPSKNIKYKHEIVNQFIKYFSSNLNYIKLTMPYAMDDVRPFQWNNFNVNVHYTFTKSIDNLNSVYEGFDPDVKRRIKKAEGKPFQMISSFDTPLIEDHFLLQKETFKRQNIQAPLGKSNFIHYMQNLHKKGHLKLFTLQLDQKSIASFIYLIHKNTAYYWLAASDPSFYKDGINQFLFWKSIETLSNQGIHFFDFVGASTPTIAEYKATYNFDLTPYYGVEKIFDRLTKSLFMLKK